MEDIIHEDPKTVVEYLTNALRPQAFKRGYLSRPTYKPVKRDAQIFLKWLKPQLDEFMKYEAHIQATTTTQSNAPKAPVGPHCGGLSKAFTSAKKPVSGMSKPASTYAEVIPPTTKQGRQSKTNMKPKPRTCFKCNDPTHGVFQCPNMENVQEAKMLYEQHIGRKIVRDVPVGAIGSTTVDEDVNAKHHPIPARVNNIVDAMETLDSGAVVTLMSSAFFQELKASSESLGRSFSHMTSSFLDFKFDTPGGPLVLLRRLQSEYVFTASDDQGAPIAVGNATQAELQLSPEEVALVDIEEKAYFPVYSEPRNPGTAPDDAVTDALRERVQEATIMCAPPEYIDGLELLLDGMCQAFALELRNDPPVDMLPVEIKLKPEAKPHLLGSGLCYKNPSCRWCSPPLIINKPGIGNFRMTVDVRYPDEIVEPTASPMPIFDVEFDRLRGSKYYFSLDFLQRFGNLKWNIRARRYTRYSPRKG
ncbi:hypothetical protein PHMEG_00029909 [Phytophthora megakarya]|uniref:Uncharacterized protein n=1 Tax=Phytophthora megakarya TaxID=4795 RepID=A0A225V015_9STRA|nr:hypothetical protein PHMEG_00029909 [Phytophthora megakarya]